MFHNFIKLISAVLALCFAFSCSYENQQPNRVPQAPVYQFQPQYTPNSYYYTPQQQYQNPSPYQYQQPASRYYSNPYAVQPQNAYPYYDGDQYYVPPTSYGNPYGDNGSYSAINPMR